VRDFNSHVWGEVAKKCRRAAVFIDQPTAECLHWTGGLSRLDATNTVAVRELNAFESAPASCKKAVFLISSPVSGQVETSIKCVIESSKLEYCIVVTSCHQAVDSWVKHPARDFSSGEDMTSFHQLEANLLHWMGNVNFTAEVVHLPMFLVAPPSNKLFLTPPFSRLWPPLEPDLAHSLALWKGLHPGNPAPLGVKGQVEWQVLPLELQANIRQFIANFHSLMSTLKMREEIWSVGPFSRVIGDQLEAWGPARARRKTATERVSLILVDRTLDLVGPASHGGDNLLSRLVQTLPRLPGHTVDVAVDLGKLMGVEEGGEVLASGCMVGPGINQETEDLEMESVMFQAEKESLSLLHKHLTEASPRRRTETGGKKFITGSILEAGLKDFEMDYESLLGNLSTVAISEAAAQCLSGEQASQRARMMGLSGQLIRAVGAGGGDVMEDLTSLVRGRMDHHLGLEDILLLLVTVYSCMLPQEQFPIDDEERLQSVLGEAVLVEGKAGRLGDVLTQLCEKATAPGGKLDEVVAHSVVSSIWRRLAALQEAREGVQKYRDLADPVVGYSGLLDQLLEDVYSEDRHEVVDMNHHGGGLGAMLRSGFGWLGSSAKAHPRENPWVVVYVVGGVTPGEVSRLQRLVPPTSKLTIAGTRLLAPKDTLDMIFINNCLLTD